jgi:20S proteasome alpha/beta subunit
MTICIAAKCGEGVIFGAADRMKTAGDIQFEPPTPKVFLLTSSIAVMTAGDAAFQAEIIQELHNVVSLRIKEEPSQWLKVKDIAYLYAYFLNLLKQKRSENAILLPLGLNKDTFITRQNEMSQEFVASLTKEMLLFNVPTVCAIVTGIDDEGTHIYYITENQVSCMDTIGFASIGSGSRHAESQFMFARHSFNSPLPETLLLTYSAKKRSEVSPGVGKETDMFMIGPGLGSYTSINSSVMKKLDDEYKKIIKKENKILQEAKKEVTRYITEILENVTKNQNQAVPEIDGENPITDKISDVN